MHELDAVERMTLDHEAAAIKRSKSEADGGLLRSLGSLTAGTRWARTLHQALEALTLYITLPMRRLSALLSWEDPYVTTWLYLGLLALLAFLCLIPMELVIYYGVYYGARTLGFLATGPWMHLVGRWLERSAEADEADEAAFARMSRRERERELQSYREVSSSEEFSEEFCL